MDLQSIWTIIAVVSAIAGVIVVVAVPVWRINTARQTIALLEQQNDALRHEREDAERRSRAEITELQQKVADLDGQMKVLSEQFAKRVATDVAAQLRGFDGSFQ